MIKTVVLTTSHKKVTTYDENGKVVHSLSGSYDKVKWMLFQSLIHCKPEIRGSQKMIWRLNKDFHRYYTKHGANTLSLASKPVMVSNNEPEPQALVLVLGL